MLQIGNVVFVDFQTIWKEPVQECTHAALPAIQDEIRRNRALLEGLTDLVSKLAYARGSSVCPGRKSDSGEQSPAPHTTSETSLV